MDTRKFINRMFALPALAVTTLGLAACADKPKSDNIIVKKPAKTVRKGVQKMGEYSQTRHVEWLDGTYTVVVERHADTSLPQAVDEQGNRYYDNRITVRVMRPDGTEFFSRTFSKADFAQYVDADDDNGALLGIVFDRVDGASLRFAASVGSPDSMSDEYVPLVLTIGRGGGVAIAKDTQLDTTSDGSESAADDDEDGV